MAFIKHDFGNSPKSSTVAEEINEFLVVHRDTRNIIWRHAKGEFFLHPVNEENHLHRIYATASSNTLNDNSHFASNPIHEPLCHPQTPAFAQQQARYPACRPRSSS